MHPKDPISDVQKTDTIYHWKCPAHNCTTEYVGETNRSIKERVSDHRNLTTSAIRNHHISTNHLKAELKDFTKIGNRDGNTLHCSAREALHIHIKDPSLNRNIGKVRIPSVFNKPFKPHTQLEQLLHWRGAPSSLGLSTQRQLTLHIFLISIYNRNVIPMFTLFKPQTTEFLDPHLQRKTVFTDDNLSSSPKKYLSFKFSGLLISSSTKAEEGTS